MKSVTVITDDITQEISRSFDYEFEGTTTFNPLEISPLDRQIIGDEWKTGVIVGPSGSGKSTLLNEFGSEEVISWEGDRTQNFGRLYSVQNCFLICNLLAIHL